MIAIGMNSLVCNLVVHSQIKFEEIILPTVGTKRKFTFPSNECREVGLEPSDECDIFVLDGNITIIPLKPGIS